MPLAKRFLHPRTDNIKPSPVRLIMGIVLGLLFAVSFYTLLYYFREILRVFNTDLIYYEVLELSRQEMNFYNTFCAFLSVIMGQSVCFTFWFHRPGIVCRGSAARARRMVNGFWTLNILTVWMLLQFFGVAGFIFFWRAEIDFGLYPDYNIYFILVIIVLFLQQWLNINRIFKRRGLKWMAVSAGVITVLSFGLSRVDVVDYESVNDKFRSKNIYYQYDIDLPEVNYNSSLGGRSDRDVVGNIYIVNSLDGEGTGKPIILINYTWHGLDENESEFREIGPEEIHHIAERLSSIDEFWFNPRYNLGINRNIPMIYVDQIRKGLAKADVRLVNYFYTPVNFPPVPNFIKRIGYPGLSVLIPFYLGSKEEFDKVCEDHLGISNIIVVSVYDNGLYMMNGTPLTSRGLYLFFKQIVEEYRDDYMVKFYLAANDTFQDYINVVSALHLAAGELREEYITRHNPKDHWEVQKLYPVKIFELPDWYLD